MEGALDRMPNDGPEGPPARRSMEAVSIAVGASMTGGARSLHPSGHAGPDGARSRGIAIVAFVDQSAHLPALPPPHGPNAWPGNVASRMSGHGGHGIPEAGSYLLGDGVAPMSPASFGLSGEEGARLARQA